MKDDYYFEHHISCTCHDYSHGLFISVFKHEKNEPPFISINMFVDNYTNVFRRIWEAFKDEMEKFRIEIQSPPPKGRGLFRKGQLTG
jgi:hypothetical protein